MEIISAQESRDIASKVSDNKEIVELNKKFVLKVIDKANKEGYFNTLYQFIGVILYEGNLKDEIFPFLKELGYSVNENTEFGSEYFNVSW